jgi:hypothetical protein
MVVSEQYAGQMRTRHLQYTPGTGTPGNVEVTDPVLFLGPLAKDMSQEL